MNKFFSNTILINAFKNCIPVSCTVEITRYCNFRCKHCYVPSDHMLFLPYENAVKFIDQIASKGCLFLTITGGECLSHPNFIEIYKYAFSKNLLISVFTNGSMLNNKHFKLFKKYPPYLVEITLYGFSEETYKDVTGVSSFHNVTSNILKLKKLGINISLKMFVLKNNYNDFSLVKKFSSDNDIPFRFDYIILDKNKLLRDKYQIDSSKIKHLELHNSNVIPTDASITTAWDSAIKEVVPTKLFNCAAGRNSCWLKADNNLYICNFFKKICYNMNEYTFEEAWSRIVNYISAIEKRPGGCFDCAKKEFCGICPVKCENLENDFYMQRGSPIYCLQATCRKEVSEQ